MTALLEWFQANAASSPWAYAWLFLASLIEYVFPPFPGDAIALLGIFLAVTSGMSAPQTYLALNLGALLGGLGAYAFGRHFAEVEKRPAFLRTPKTAAMLAEVEAKIAKHGAVILMANRFIPAMRSFFFVGAGIARVPAWKVALYGGISACAWNAILFGLGTLAGNNLAQLQTWVERYSLVAVSLFVLALAVYVVRRMRRKVAQ
jgi:membrane protein DedA with SNARE-associated domain